MIASPILQLAYDNDWYYPWDAPKEVRNHPAYQKAQREGWAEWIETPYDFAAIKDGFVYDQSLDVDGKPIYWVDGCWQRQNGEKVPVEYEHEVVAHAGRGDQMLRFGETFLQHTKGEIAGTPFRFIHWHYKLCAGLFGWVHEESKRRRYRHLTLEIAKKNTKSALLSVFALYGLVGDEIDKNYVYGCACDRNQARIVYDEAANYVKNSDKLQEVITVVDSRARLVHRPSGSYYAVLSADAHRNDGLDSSLTLVDEIHRHPNRKLYAVMERAGIARAEPLMCVITTYGPSLSDGSIWAEIHHQAKKQLEGDPHCSYRNMVWIASAEPITVTALQNCPVGATKIPVHRLEQPVDVSEIEFDLSQFDQDSKVLVKIVEPAKRFQDHLVVQPIESEIPAFSEAIANTDWRSDHAIRRANPSLGVTVEIDTIRDIINASQSPEKEAETKQLNLNIVSGSGRKWLSSAAWLACGKKQVQPKKLIGRHCYAGLDISFGNDLIGFGLAFPNWPPGVRFEEVEQSERRIDLLTWAWLPTYQIEDREHLERFPYRHYSRQNYLFDGRGCIRLCGERVVNFPQIADDIIEICKEFEVVGLAYDPNYGSFIIPALETVGLTCVAHRQGAVSMSPPCKRFSQGVYEGWIAHGNNPVLDRAVEGAQLHPPDKAGNTYLAKGTSKTRIDPLVAQVMAVGFCCNPPEGLSMSYSSASSGMWG